MVLTSQERLPFLRIPNQSTPLPPPFPDSLPTAIEEEEESKRRKRTRLFCVSLVPLVPSCFVTAGWRAGFHGD